MPIARQRVVRVELAEAAAESDVLLARYFLVAEQLGNAVVEEGLVDLGELIVVDRGCDVEALNFGAEAVRQGSEGKVSWGYLLGATCRRNEASTVHIALPAVNRQRCRRPRTQVAVRKNFRRSEAPYDRRARPGA